MNPVVLAIPEMAGIFYPQAEQIAVRQHIPATHHRILSLRNP